MLEEVFVFAIFVVSTVVFVEPKPGPQALLGRFDRTAHINDDTRPYRFHVIPNRNDKASQRHP